MSAFVSGLSHCLQFCQVRMKYKLRFFLDFGLHCRADCTTCLKAQGLKTLEVENVNLEKYSALPVTEWVSKESHSCVWCPR